MPLVVQKYYYRRWFGLSAEQMEQEPIDQFFTNYEIYNQIQEREEAERSLNKQGTSNG